jgi:hypothetical protein
VELVIVDRLRAAASRRGRIRNGVRGSMDRLEPSTRGTPVKVYEDLRASFPIWSKPGAYSDFKPFAPYSDGMWSDAGEREAYLWFIEPTTNVASPSRLLPRSRLL